MTLLNDGISGINSKIENKTSAGLGHKTVVAVIPAHNEAKAISQVVLTMLQHVTMVLVVDDGSCDNTAALAEAAGALVVRHTQNQGKGAALRTGFKAAAKLNPDAVVTIDADGQHLPTETSRVIAPVLAGQADLVVGSRYLQHTSRVPYHRVCGHYFFKLVINRLSGVAITDTQSGFRAFSIRALRMVNAFQADGFGVESEMQFQAHKFQLRVTEVPITVRYYQEVKRSVIKQGLTVLSQVLRLTLHYRPGMVYSAAGMAVLFLVNLVGGMMWVANLPETSVQSGLHYLAISSPSLIGVVTVFTGAIVRTGQPFIRLRPQESKF
jgi:glycosyltransferase involved in cell wall biosynthesis